MILTTIARVLLFISIPVLITRYDLSGNPVKNRKVFNVQ
ncbi:hypothetical protein SNSL317_A2684 [Salmonella enterica subsp. enterica serovar Newport str. SL317]|nr:hypothetical protein SNSL317_A2684 [Salmonella enterica subsp. enterica serovar Newport str. SL317]